MNEKYSVLMSVYAKEKPEYLRQSIESILAQTVAADEFVIVCDGPLTEELDKVLAEYENSRQGFFKIIRQKENKGLGIALNTGLSQCANSLVARMDSDDVSMPDRMERQLAVFAEKNVDIVSGTVAEFTKKTDNVVTKRVLPENPEEIRRFAKRRNPFNHPAVMYKKDSVMKAGGYEDFMLFEDYYLWIRMLCMGCEGYNIPEEILYMRSGDSLYERRGGITYAKQIIRFRFFMLRCGYTGIGDFIVTAVGHSLIALVPNGVRKKFYERLLRK